MGELELCNKIKGEFKKGYKEVKVPVRVFVDVWFGNQKFTDSDLTDKMLNFADNCGVDYTITVGNNPVYNFWKSFEKRRPLQMEIRKF